MSSMLEQAIIDADALKEAALKNAEQEKRIKKNKFTQWIKLKKLSPLVNGCL